MNYSTQIKKLSIIKPKQIKIQKGITLIFIFLIFLFTLLCFIFNNVFSINEYLKISAETGQKLLGILLFFIFIFPLCLLVYRKISTLKQLLNLIIDDNEIILTDGKDSRRLPKASIRQIIPYSSETYRRRSITFNIASGIKIEFYDKQEIFNLLIETNDFKKTEKAIEELKIKKYPVKNEFKSVKNKFDSIQSINENARKIAKIGGIFLIILIIGLLILIIKYN